MGNRMVLELRHEVYREIAVMKTGDVLPAGLEGCCRC